MDVAILESYLYHETEEIQGQDRIVWGGAERYLFELCKLFQSKGHHVAVYQPLNQHVLKDERYVKVKSGQVEKDFFGIPVVCLPDTDEGWSLSVNPSLNMQFNEIAKFFDLAIYFVTCLCWPNVVHPSVSISHGIFWDYPEHGWKSWKEDERKEFFRRHLYGFTAPDLCVAVDTNVKKVLMALDPGAESSVEVVYNFVDTEKFKPAHKSWKGIRVLHPRRLTTLRGCNDLIRASLDCPEYEFYAVGQSFSEALDQKASMWSRTTKNVRFIQKPMHEMPAVYRMADIAVVPTKAAEGLSLSLLESMASGLPVITTCVGGLGDAVIDGYNALVYDPSREKMSHYIRFLAENENLRRKMGERNREIAVECFDIKLWKAKWLEIIGRFQ